MQDAVAILMMLSPWIFVGAAFGVGWRMSGLPESHPDHHAVKSLLCAGFIIAPVTLFVVFPVVMVGAFTWFLVLGKPKKGPVDDGDESE